MVKGEFLKFVACGQTMLPDRSPLKIIFWCCSTVYFLLTSFLSFGCGRPRFWPAQHEVATYQKIISSLVTALPRDQFESQIESDIL